MIAATTTIIIFKWIVFTAEREQLRPNTHGEKAVGEQASEALARAITDQDIPLASDKVQ